MVSEIKLGGLGSVPAENEAQPGQLGVGENILRERGALRVLGAPGEVSGLPAGCDGGLLHGSGEGRRIVAFSSGGRSVAWKYAGEDDASWRQVEIDFDADWADGYWRGVVMENIVALSGTDGSVRYMLWDGESGDYKWLGEGMPGIRAEFGLACYLEKDKYPKGGMIEVEENGITTEQGWDHLSDIHGWRADMHNSSGSPYHVNEEYERTPLTGLLPAPLEQGAEYRIEMAAAGDKKAFTGDTWAELYGSTMATPTQDSWQKISYWTGLHALKFRAMEAFKHLALAGGRHVSQGSFYFGEAGRIVADITLYKGQADPSLVTRRIKHTENGYACVMAAANKFVRDYGAKKNRFMYPFYARMAVRLWDGTQGWVSEPVLLCPNTGVAPWISYEEDSDNLVVRGVAAALEMKIDGLPEQGSAWWKLVQGVDVYVSEGVWAYDQGEAYDQKKTQALYWLAKNGVNKSVGSLNQEGHRIDVHKVWDLEPMAANYLNMTAGAPIVLPGAKKQERIRGELARVGAYYRVASIEMEELGGYAMEMREVKIEDGVVENLTVQQALREEMLAVVPEGMCDVYNTRLHVYGGRTRLREPSEVWRLNGRIDDDYVPGQNGTQMETWVLIKTSEGVKMVRTGQSGRFGTLRWYYYPDARAHSVVVGNRSLNDQGKVVFKGFSLPLRPHPVLNGAYWLSEDITEGYKPGYVSQEGFGERFVIEDEEKAAERVYVSEAGNPFAWRASGVVRPGGGEVVGVAAACQALSQGQFGSYPLYVFTSEGVWALSVNAEGLYGTARPVTRDVCTDGDGITSVDRGVAFPTAQGVMLIEGGSAVCLNKAVDEVDVAGKTVRELLRQCRVAYDYGGSRLWFGGGKGSLVYSLESKEWASSGVSFHGVCNSYPECWVIERDEVKGAGKVLDLGHLTESGECRLVTRAIRLAPSGSLATVRRMVMKGICAGRLEMEVTLEGCRELGLWHKVASCRGSVLGGISGSGWRWIRVKADGLLKKGDVLTGIAFEWAQKKGRRLM